MTLHLDSETRRALVMDIADELERRDGFRKPVLSLARAVAFVDAKSVNAFHAWCRRMGVENLSNGRYSRGELQRAMEREARRPRTRRGK